MSEKNTSKWTVLMWVAVAVLTVKTFLPGVWMRAGEEIQPVIDGAQRVVNPDSENQDDDVERGTYLISNSDQKPNPDDEEFRFWKPVGGKP